MSDSNVTELVRKLKLYQTKAHCYLVGRTEDKKHFRICKFGRLEVIGSIITLKAKPHFRSAEYSS